MTGNMTINAVSKLLSSEFLLTPPPRHGPLPRYGPIPRVRPPMLEPSLPVFHIRRVDIIRQLIPQHRKLIRPQMESSRFDRIQRGLDFAFRPGEDSGEGSADDEDGDSGPEVPDYGPGDGCHAEEGGEVGDWKEEGCHDGEECGVVGLDGVGDVEFEFDKVVETWKKVGLVSDLGDESIRTAWTHDP